ncbi:MAG TPA: cohesin domain-containing protein [Acidobacteriota bacterium]|nr:cohesin domain-containing protein [Acidobacteriota bacterium]
MSDKCKSYLTVAAVFIIATAAASDAGAQRIFLDPDTVFITTGVDTEFELDLRVDSDITSLKLFVFWLNFDPTRLDTVSVTEGPLFPSSGAVTVFNYYLVGDTVLQIEGLILGAGVDVSGPGLLATIRLKAIDSGFADLSMFRHETRDILNVLVESEAAGAPVFINCPPDEFNLVSPISGHVVSGFPGDQFDLVWNRTRSVYPGESVRYTLDYGTSPTFNPSGTTTLDDLIDTTFTLWVDDLVEAVYYWRVSAEGNLYGYERPSTPPSESFEFVYGLVEPEEFDLLTPQNDVLFDIFGSGDILFDWEDALSVIPGDSITYEFCLGPDPDVPAGAVIVDSTEDVSQLLISTADVPLGEWDYWCVNAVNKFGLNTWSTSIRSAMFYQLADLDHDRIVDIADLTSLISFLFISHVEPVPYEAANCDCEGTVDIGDLTLLIGYLFMGRELLPCP